MGRTRALLVSLCLFAACQCFVPVEEDGGVSDAGSAGGAVGGGGAGGTAGGSAQDSGTPDDAGLDAGEPDSGLEQDGGLDAGGPDSGVELDGGSDAGTDGGEVDSGVVLDAGLDAGADAGMPADASVPSCATIRCTAWSVCDEDAGAICVPTVTALRWLVPAADASVPRDTIRLAVAVEIAGSADSVPVVATGAGQASTIATRTDGGVAVGSLSFSSLSSGRLQLTAGWVGGPDAGTSVTVLPSSAVVLGSTAPIRGANTPDYQPNDPEGPAWRRDDLVPFVGWPGTQLLVRRLHPDASISLLDAGAFSDGGQYFRLQDIEFEAFRDQVEFRAVTESWESAPQQITVTRWRWRRVVAAPTGTLKIQQPVVQRFPTPRHIVVGTQDTATSGRLIQLDREGIPTGAFPDWDAGVTTPFLSEVGAVGGVDADGGFIFLRDGIDQYIRLDAPLASAGAATVEDSMLAVTVRGRWFEVVQGSIRKELGLCTFDAGAPLRNIAGFGEGFVISEAGEVCTTDVNGPPRILPSRVSPMSVAGPGWGAFMTSTSGELLLNYAPTGLAPVDGGPRHANFMVVERLGYLLQPPPALYAATPTSIEVWPLGNPPATPAATFAGPAFSLPLTSPLATSPLLRRSGARRWLLLVDTGGSLRSVDVRVLDGQWAVSPDGGRSFDAPVLREQWAWSPDGGLQLQAPLGFGASASLLGTLLLVADGAVLAVVADGDAHDLPEPRDAWLMGSGTSTGCHDGCSDEPKLP